MSQNRDDLPWFPMYASNMISDKRYRQMEPIEKGLWISMLLECWSNGSVPADPSDLAKWLSWSIDDIKAGLTDRVRSFFEEAKGELISPQLEKHYQKQRGTQQGKSEGGKKGAKRRWNKGAEDMGNPSAIPIGNPSGDQLGNQMGPLNTIQFNSFKSNSVSKEEVIQDPWLDDYSATEAMLGNGTDTADAYRRASQGE